MAKLSSEKYLVLMVDDSEDDCLLIRRAIGKADRLRFIGSAGFVGDVGEVARRA